MVLRKKVAIFDWEWDRNSAPREGQKMPSIILPCLYTVPPKTLVSDDHALP